jgi:hypothetical protein
LEKFTKLTTKLKQINCFRHVMQPEVIEQAMVRAKYERGQEPPAKAGGVNYKFNLLANCRWFLSMLGNCSSFLADLSPQRTSRAVSDMLKEQAPTKRQGQQHYWTKSATWCAGLEKKEKLSIGNATIVMTIPLLSRNKELL